MRVPLSVRTPALSAPVTGAILCAAIIAAVRLLMLDSFSMSMPFWDQWDGELARLLKPWVVGTLPMQEFFSPHNEHRIFFTRVWNLILFAANGEQFDNLVVASANALAYAVALTCLGMVASRQLRPAARFALMMLVLVVGISAAGWENLLSGFHNQFYAMMVFCPMALWLVTGRMHGLLYLALACVAMCTLLTMASGMLVLPAAAVVVAVRLWRNELPLLRALAGGLIVLAVFGVGLLVLPHVPGHDPMKAKDAAEFASAWLQALSWPLPWQWAAPVLWLPTLVVAARILDRRRVVSRTELWLLGMSGWIILQAVAIAYSRGHDMTYVSARYTDLLAMGVLANAGLALRLIPQPGSSAGKSSRTAAVCTVAAYFLMVTTALSWRASQAVEEMRGRHEIYLVEQANVRAFLQSDNAAHLLNKPFLHVPFPNAEFLLGLLRDPDIRQMLPQGVAPPAPLSSSQGNFIPGNCGAVGPADTALVAPRDRVGVLRTTALPAHSGRLHVGFCGTGPATLTLKGRVPGDQVARRLPSLPAGRCAIASLPAPAGQFVLEVVSQPGPDAFCIGDVQHVGPLSRLARWLLSAAPLLLGAVLLLALVWLAWVLAPVVRRVRGAAAISPLGHGARD